MQKRGGADAGVRAHARLRFWASDLLMRREAVTNGEHEHETTEGGGSEVRICTTDTT